MNEHEKQKQVELADGVGDVVDAFVARTSERGEMIWVRAAVKLIAAQVPGTELTPAELAEAIVRVAAARRVAIAIDKMD